MGLCWIARARAASYLSVQSDLTRRGVLPGAGELVCVLVCVYSCARATSVHLHLCMCFGWMRLWMRACVYVRGLRGRAAEQLGACSQLPFPTRQAMPVRGDTRTLARARKGRLPRKRVPAPSDPIILGAILAVFHAIMHCTALTAGL